MITEQVKQGKKQMVAMNIDKRLYHKVKVYAAQMDTTITKVIEQSLRAQLNLT